jgi:hypothetical protein
MNFRPLRLALPLLATGFLAFAAVLCLFAWLYDRRNPRT